MKRVTLKQLSLINFKGIKGLTINFGQVTEIRGANATGKSTVADAFNWVLFGKDVAGNSDSKFGIKTNDVNGSPIPKLDHEVTVLLDVDGESVELRRVLSEDWVTPRGKAEPELKGNSTAYFYNGVPLKESEYKAKISEIISEDLFRMITGPRHFPSLKWEEQRAILLSIAGDVSLEEIAKSKSEFAALLSRLSGKSLAEYKAEISARKKKIKETLDLIPARIDEVTRATPTIPDFAALEAEKMAIEKGVEAVESAMKNAAELARAEYEKQAAVQKQINDLRAKQQKLLFGARQVAREAHARENAEYDGLVQRRDAIKRQMSIRTQETEDFKAVFRKNLLKIGELSRHLDAKRAEWTQENAKEYNPADKDICPSCGQRLPEEKIAGFVSNFEAHKQKMLDKINAEGKEAKLEKENLEAKNAELKTQIDELSAKQAAQAEQLEACEQKLESTTRSEYREPQETDIKEIVDIEADVNALEVDLKALKDRAATGDNSEFATKKQELSTQLDGIKKQLALKDVISNNAKRKAELFKEEKELAQQKADLEKQEFTADALIKEQMNEVERRVNGKFNLVRFKMFSQQINGGEKPDCILISKATGARFLDTNSADKTNIGLDIINTLCEFSGVCAPIFVDNAEGINQLLPVNSQLVKLIVTTDKELTVNYQ